MDAAINLGNISIAPLASIYVPDIIATYLVPQLNGKDLELASTSSTSCQYSY
jgi:hypothetical protein